jgi:chromosome segregation ATPase
VAAGKGGGAKQSDIEALNAQIASLQRQLTGEQQKVQDRLDTALTQLKAESRRQAGAPAASGNLRQQLAAQAADIERIKAYLRDPRGAFGPGNGKR